MKKLLAALLRPVIEESMRQIHARRADEADAVGMDAIDRFGFMVLGADPLRRQDESSGHLIPPE